jgi:hypothetical protein
MSDRATALAPQSGIIAATGLQNRGPLPPVCPPPENDGRKPASPWPCCPWIPPTLRVLALLPTSFDHRPSPNHLANVLPKRLRFP